MRTGPEPTYEAFHSAARLTDNQSHLSSYDLLARYKQLDLSQLVSSVS
jgi:hypothetical protein